MKLTKEIREKIASDTVKGQFAKREKDLKKAHHEMGMKLYNFVFDEATRKAVKKVPEKWLRHCDCLRFNCNGWNLRFNVDKPVPTPNSSHCDVLGSVTGDLATEAQELSKEEQKYRDDLSSAYRALITMLNELNTMKQLQDTWPEGKQYYGKYLKAKEGSTLPAIQVSEVNKILGIAP
jgi:hypothetical protein